jgi:hypothetical protein
MQSMYYVGLDVHKKTISYCVKDGSGHIQSEGTIPATRMDLDGWRLQMRLSVTHGSKVLEGILAKRRVSYALTCPRLLCASGSEREFTR